MNETPKNLNKFEALVDIVSRLRGPDGCPWDKSQTHESLVRYTLEEASEFAEALLSGDPQQILDEGGDLLLQVVLNCQILSENNQGDITESIKKICEKMIRRHPHVFGDVKFANSEEVRASWIQIKAEEKKNSAVAGQNSERLELSSTLRALEKAHKIGELAGRAGFDWNSPQEILAKVEEEVRELREALESGDQAHTREELGDCFFALSQMARHLKTQGEVELMKANSKFLNRYNQMVTISENNSQVFSKLTLEEKEQLWVKVKASHKHL